MGLHNKMQTEVSDIQEKLLWWRVENEFRSDSNEIQEVNKRLTATRLFLMQTVQYSTIVTVTL